ncbi:MAG: ion transporter [Alphaproteobacteria bacterium]|nr:ion transporter [Alphaproteobacteria bacterium]
MSKTLSINTNRYEFFFHSSPYHWFYTTLLFLTLGDVVLIALDRLGPETVKLLREAVLWFRVIFVVELVVRAVLLQKLFWKNQQNIFVAFVLAASFFLKVPELVILLSFVSLKSFRMIEFLPKTRNIIDAFIRTLPGVFNVLLMIILAYVVFGALATHLFGPKVPALWGDFMTSFLSLQQAMLGDDWGNNLRATMKFYPHAWVFLAVFLFVVSMILLNLFVGIIVDSMQSVEEKSNESSDDSQPLVSKSEFDALRQDIADIKALLKKPRD